MEVGVIINLGQANDRNVEVLLETAPLQAAGR